MGHFYKAIMQSILLYAAGSETWVLPPQLLTKLLTFYRRPARYINHRHIRSNADVIGWIYPNSDSVLEDAGLFEIGTELCLNLPREKLGRSR